MLMQMEMFAGRWHLACATLLAVTLAGCVYERPVYVSAPPNKFDRSWDAALGAAEDVGVAMTSADRSTGIIRGTRNGVDVMIAVRTQADASVRVEFNAKGPAGQDAVLAERLSNAYERRMGR
jgi:hypothetical protein